MLRAGALLLVLTLAVITACGKPAAKDPAAAVQALLSAAQAGDAARFEAAVDRPAVRADLRRQLSAVARDAGVEVDGGPSDQALDRIIAPEAIRQVEAETGPLPAKPDDLKPRLKHLGRGQVCLHDGSAEQACLLTFAHEKRAHGQAAGWRLVGMLAPDHDVQIGLHITP